MTSARIFNVTRVTLTPAPPTGVRLAGGATGGRGAERRGAQPRERARQDSVRRVGDADAVARARGGRRASRLRPGHQPRGDGTPRTPPLV